MPSFWKRLVCLVRGHRDLSRADEYGAIFRDGTLHELHHCGYCGRPVWITRPAPAVPPSASVWEEMGV